MHIANKSNTNQSLALGVNLIKSRLKTAFGILNKLTKLGNVRHRAMHRNARASRSGTDACRTAYAHAARC